MFYVICDKCDGVAFVYPHKHRMPQYSHERYDAAGNEVHGIHIARYPDGRSVTVRVIGKTRRVKAKCHSCREYIDESHFATMRYMRSKKIGIRSSADSKVIALRSRFGTLLECAGRMRFFLEEISQHGEVGMPDETVQRARWALGLIEKFESDEAGILPPTMEAEAGLVIIKEDEDGQG